MNSEEVVITDHLTRDLLTVSSTITVIAIALATLTIDQGPRYSGVYLLPTLFLVAGLLALLGSLYAFETIWDNVMASGEVQSTQLVALVATNAGLWLLGLGYIILLFATAV